MVRSESLNHIFEGRGVANQSGLLADENLGQDLVGRMLVDKINKEGIRIFHDGISMQEYICQGLTEY
jgi:hypothetical protein